MDGGAWWAAVLGVAGSWTRLSNFSLSCIGGGNGTPLQCSCLENPRDGEPGGLPSWGRTESDTTDAPQQHSTVTTCSSREAVSHCAFNLYLTDDYDAEE